MIMLGASDWEHSSLLREYYPTDMPPEWRVSYYSNEFPAVWLPNWQWTNMSPQAVASLMAETPPAFRVVLESGPSWRDRKNTWIETGRVAAVCELPSASENLAVVTKVVDPICKNVSVTMLSARQLLPLRQVRDLIEKSSISSSDDDLRFIFVEATENMAKYLQEIRVLLRLMGY